MHAAAAAAGEVAGGTTQALAVHALRILEANFTSVPYYSVFDAHRHGLAGDATHDYLMKAIAWWGLYGLRGCRAPPGPCHGQSARALVTRLSSTGLLIASADEPDPHRRLRSRERSRAFAWPSGASGTTCRLRPPYGTARRRSTSMAVSGRKSSHRGQYSPGCGILSQ